MIRISSKREAVMMESKDNQNILFFNSYLGNLNNLLMLQCKLLKCMYADCLNFLCFLNYLSLNINATYKNFMKVQVWSTHVSSGVGGSE